MLIRKLYVDTPTTDVMLETKSLAFVRIRSGQRMVYMRMGIIGGTPKRAGIRLIFSPFNLWGSGIVVNTDQIRNEPVEVKTVQTRDNIELLSATASLFYNITRPAQTVRAAFDDKKKKLDYQNTIKFIAEARLRQFIRGKTLEDLNGISVEDQDILKEDATTKKYLLDKLGINAHKLLYRRIDLPSELEAELAERIVATEEAKGRLEIAKIEPKIAAEYEGAAEIYSRFPDALVLRGYQSLDNLVETQKQNPNMIWGLDPMFASLLTRIRQNAERVGRRVNNLPTPPESSG